MAPVLSVRDVTKGFGGVPVLTGVGLDLEPGTVTALAGENGAGKSTLLKIASGQYRADGGSVSVDGHELHGSVADAHRAGVAIVPQELASIPEQSVYENLFVGRELHRFGLLDRRSMIKAARSALADFGVEIDVTAPMRRLPVGIQQIIEIVKATHTGARVLLLDEPTSAISEREVEQLYRVVRRLRSQGVAMIYTTHKMEEIRALADRVVVLRDGSLIMDQPIAAVSDEDIVTAMIGRELGTLFPDITPAGEDVVLEIDGLHVTGAGGPVSLQVRRGEIVGLAGLVGAGRTELLEAIFGVRRSDAGVIRVHGKTLARGAPRSAIRRGLAMVPEDRKASGAVLGMSVLDNGSLPHLARFTRGGVLRPRARTQAVQQAMTSVRLRSRGLGQEVGTLSGGNQQKVVFARWLTGEIDVLLLDEPTRGVDVGARSEIYRIITDLAAGGVAVIMASSDMPEILGLAHRALVLADGQVAGELDRAELGADDAQARIFTLATGDQEASPAATGAATDDEHGSEDVR